MFNRYFSVNEVLDQIANDEELNNGGVRVYVMPPDHAGIDTDEDSADEDDMPSVVGVDHVDPFYCVHTGEEKLHILIITCAITRVVHIELVDSLMTEDTVLALTRFSARRSIPAVKYSDNAKSFRRASQLIQGEMEHTTITWKFNAPLAP